MLRICLAILALSLFAMPHSGVMAQGGTNDTSAYLRNFVTSRPTVSPYLALVQNPQNQQAGGSSQLAQDYLNRVRPQIDQRQQAAQQQRQLNSMRQQLDRVQSDVQRAQEQGGFGVTGHPTRFMQYYNYYPGFLSVNRRR